MVVTRAGMISPTLITLIRKIHIIDTKTKPTYRDTSLYGISVMFGFVATKNALLCCEFFFSKFATQLEAFCSVFFCGKLFESAKLYLHGLSQ